MSLNLKRYVVFPNQVSLLKTFVLTEIRREKRR